MLVVWHGIFPTLASNYSVHGSEGMFPLVFQVG